MIYLLLDLGFATFLNIPTYLFLIPLFKNINFHFYFKLILIYDLFFLKSYFLFSLIILFFFFLNNKLKLNYIIKYIIFYFLFYLFHYFIFFLNFKKNISQYNYNG